MDRPWKWCMGVVTFLKARRGVRETFVAALPRRAIDLEEVIGLMQHRSTVPGKNVIIGVRSYAGPIRHTIGVK